MVQPDLMWWKAAVKDSAAPDMDEIFKGFNLQRLILEVSDFIWLNNLAANDLTIRITKVVHHTDLSAPK